MTASSRDPVDRRGDPRALATRATLVVGLAVALAACDRAEAARADRDAPLVVKPRRLHLLAIDPADWREVAARFEPSIVGKGGARVRSPSLSLHTLRLRGLDGEFDDPALSTGAKVLESLLDNRTAEQVFGTTVWIRTPYGVRCRPPRLLPAMRTDAEESHPGQALAGLGELGIGLDRALGLLGGEAADDGMRPAAAATIADVLDDTIADFHLFQPEFEWTSVALSLYLPPRDRWKNRYGEETTFDDLAARLIDKDLSRVSCGGTHVLYAMTILLRADASEPVLSDARRDQLRDRVKDLVARAVRRQDESGYWDIRWFQAPRGQVTGRSAAGVDAETGTDRPPTIHEIERRMLVTGHLAEVLLYLPDDLTPDDDCMARAGRWLWQHLQNAATGRRILRNICPLTHAACVVRQLRQ